MAAATTSVNGYLTSTDWTTFNNKVTSVSGTAGRITSTGGATPVIDLASGIATAGTTGSVSLIPVVTIDTYGRVTSITTAANPQGTVTSVTGTAPVVSSGGATPAISMAAATASVNGYLTSTDWTAFNNATKGPAFLAQLTSAQTIAGASYVKITLNNEIFDTNNNFDPTTNYRFTPTVAGYYQIDAALFYNTSGASGLMQMFIYKNGSTVASVANPLSAAGNVSLSLAQVVSMNGSTDYLELYTYNGNALSQTTSSGTYVYMSGSLIRGA
jgi:hypothetical protein